MMTDKRMETPGRAATISPVPGRLLVGAAALAGARLLLRSAEFSRCLAVAIGTLGARAARVACVASVSVLVCSIAWNTRAAGGSDSSCYVLQADAFAHGRLALTDPL
jgi:hypothetical protein